MNLREYLRLLRRYWPALVVCCLLGVIVASTYTATRTPQYQSTTKSFVSTGSGSNVTDLNQGAGFVQQAIKTYADVATTPYVLNEVIRKLKLHTTAAELASAVTVTAPAEETILEVTVSDPSPIRAAAIANSLAAQLGSAAQSLTPDTASPTAAVRITQLQAALPATTPASPSFRVNLLIGLLLGIIIGVLVAALADAFDTQIRSSSDVRRLSPLPILASIAYDANANRAQLVMRRRSAERLSEAYRTLRTNMELSDPGTGGRAFVVTSSIPGEGKTTTSLNLAVALADAYQSVVLVDADLRQPQVAERTGLDGGIGLTDVLAGSVKLGDALQQWPEGNLTVLTSGVSPVNPSELLQSRLSTQLIEALKKRFDIVILDTPPLLEVSDAAILARRTEGALLVCGSGRVRRPQVRGALAALDQVGAQVLGLVVTMERRRRSAPSAYQQYFEEVPAEQPQRSTSEFDSLLAK